MERKIVFRGKRIDNGEWVYGSLDSTEDRPAISWLHTDPDGTKVPWFAFVKAETVGEFTGMLDKNGVEIYEGDILGVPEDNYFLYETVFFEDGCFMVKDDYTTMPMCAVDFQYRTVIGNIYGNPSLISDKQ